MGEVIAHGRMPSGSSWRVEGTGAWLDLLPTGNRVNARNNVLRWSLAEMGYAWAGNFLARRFSNYVRPGPFFYKLSLTNTVRKFRRMGLLQPILRRELYGWDPWGSDGPPRELIDAYRRQNPMARGAFSRSGNYLTISKTIRRQSKDIIRNYIKTVQFTALKPLVETGQARTAALSGHRVTSTATAKRMRVTIGIPFGGPKNALVGKIVRTMPESEIAFCAQALASILGKRLTRTGIAPPGPLPLRVPAGA